MHTWLLSIVLFERILINLLFDAFGVLILLGMLFSNVVRFMRFLGFFVAGRNEEIVRTASYVFSIV